MATISKDSQKKVSFFSSLVTRISLVFISVVAILLLLMNTYFLTASRNMMFASKQTALQNQASVISSSLSSLDTLSSESVGQVMDLLEVGDFARVIVVDSADTTLFNSKHGNISITSSQTSEFITSALGGSDVFYSRFSDSAFSSVICMPVITNGAVSGAFLIGERDTYQGEILIGLQQNIQRISLVIAVFSIAVISIILEALIQRIKTILNAIVSVREGEYAYRIRITGNDELTRLCAEFNDLTSRLQETEELRRRFVADASHELKTPLASIRLLSDSILQNDTMSDDMVREFISDIGDEASRLARTTEKLLALTRIDNKIITIRGCTDVGTVVEAVLRILNPLSEERCINISTQLDVGCSVFASEDEIRQIALNLIENAIKYTLDGGYVHISLSKEGHSVTLTVDDNGVGIPESDLPYIFDRFYRVDKARSREAGGSGLGLAIVRNTVHELCGGITALRREEGGMRFSVTFPLYAPSYDSADSLPGNTADGGTGT